MESNSDGQICWRNSQTTQILSHKLQSPGWDVFLLSDPRQPVTEVLCYSVGGPPHFPSPSIYPHFLSPSTTTPSICWSSNFYLPPTFFFHQSPAVALVTLVANCTCCTDGKPHQTRPLHPSAVPAVCCARGRHLFCFPSHHASAGQSPTSGERIKTQEKHWEAPW